MCVCTTAWADPCRYHDFIPWDDDIDLRVHPDDWDKMVRAWHHAPGTMLTRMFLGRASAILYYTMPHLVALAWQSLLQSDEVTAPA